MKVALYLRVSKTRQELDNQRRALLTFVKAQGWTVSREYSQKKSGMNPRASLDDAMRDGEARKFDLLLFWSLDRLTREGPLKTLLYLERLRRVGVGFRSYMEPFIDSTGLGELLIPIFAWIARQESLRRSERIKAAFSRIRETGKTRSGRPIGRPTHTIGPEIITEARRLIKCGWSWREVAKRFKKPLGTLYKAVSKTCLKSPHKKPRF